MIKWMNLSVDFKNPPSEDVPTTPGGFTIKLKDGKEVTFDFAKSATSINSDGSRDFELTDADVETFPEMRLLTAADFVDMQGFTDIYIDLDEAPDSSVETVSYIEIGFSENIPGTLDAETIIRMYNVSII